MTSKLLTVFVLTGIVDSTDQFFASVELSVQPDCEPAAAVLPLSAFPCDISEGDSFHILKLTEDSEPVIVCGEFEGEIKPSDGE